jgi:CDP-diacylglycerol--glycerol-3-phosphate 3-phosphatidyltransferase
VRETGAISVWERPTRVVLTGFTLGGAGVVGATGWTEAVVVAGTAAGVLLGAAGTVQLGVSLRRALGEVPEPDRR